MIDSNEAVGIGLGGVDYVRTPDKPGGVAVEAMKSWTQSPRLVGSTS